MNTRMFLLILILVLAVLSIVVSCATSKKIYLSEENLYKELTGTWNNEEYEPPEVQKFPQVNVHSDGSFERSKEHPVLTTPTIHTGKFISIEEAWTDSKGNIWYNARVYYDNEPAFYQIGKISDSGKVWEFVNSSIDYPDKLDTEHFNYRIYYRQE